MEKKDFTLGGYIDSSGVAKVKLQFGSQAEATIRSDAEEDGASDVVLRSACGGGIPPRVVERLELLFHVAKVCEADSDYRLHRFVEDMIALGMQMALDLPKRE